VLPVRLTRRGIYILPTRHGLLFLTVLFGMLLGSINYNNNLGFLLVFLLGGMVLASIIHTWRNLLGLTLVSVGADPVFAGDPALFEVFVRSERLDRRGVSFGFEKQERILANIPPGPGVRLTVPAAAPGRGIFSPGALILATRFPLGLFRAWSRLETGASCLVYPRPLAGPFEPVKGTGAQDEDGAAGQKGGDDFQGLTPYQPGDPVRHIAWKALSRGQGLFTKDFRRDAETAVLLDYAEVTAGDTEAKLSRMADLVLQASGRSLEYGLQLPGRYLPPAKGEQHRHNCLRALALFDPRQKEPQEEGADAGPG
jgi:uncharacterized protein (DUF58 family)